MLSYGKIFHMTTSGADALAGLTKVRLGARERELLLRAPLTDGEQIRDMLAIDDPARSVRVAQARAARKLSDLGLVAYYNQLRGERRVCVRLTPLGAEVVKRYGDELRTGRRIRWPREPTAPGARMET